MRIGFIGAGKVGTTLGKYFVTGRQRKTEENFTLSGYYSRNPKSAQEAANFTNSTKYDTIEQIIEDSDLLFLTVTDDAISIVWNRIKRLPIKGKIICHCSGSLSSAIFSGIENTGAYACSIHPLFAVSSKQESYKTISQAVFTIEGTPEQLERLQNFIQSFGNTVVIVDTKEKVKYHAAAVMASNHVAALAQTALNLLEQCGFSEDSARKALGPLLCNNAVSVSEKGTMAALTGPIERNDVGTVKKHLSCLDSETAALYARLSQILIPVAEKKHPDWDYNEMKKVLCNER